MTGMTNKNCSLANNNIEIRAELNGTFNGLNVTNTKTKLVNVTETRILNLTFVPVDNPPNFDNTVEESVDFLQKTF